MQRHGPAWECGASRIMGVVGCRYPEISVLALTFSDDGAKDGGDINASVHDAGSGALQGFYIMTPRFLCAAALSAVLLSACATTNAPVPLTRKLDASQQAMIANAPVNVRDGDGVVAGWTSAAYAPDGTYASVPSYAVPAGVSPIAAGVGAGIGQAIAIAILDAAPSARARRSVEILNADIDKDALDDAFLTSLRRAAASSDLSLADISTVEMDRSDDPADGALYITTRYALAEDASAVQMQAFVTYNDETVPYQTRYTFEGKPPRAERKGPHYRNVFTYHSDRFEAPELTPAVRESLERAIEEERVALIAEADAKLADAESSGMDDKALGKARKAHAKALSSAEKNYTKAVEKAADDKLSKTEKALLIIGDWRRGATGSPLQAALNEGQDFVARMIVMDLQDPTLPPMAAPEKLDKDARAARIAQNNMGLLGLQDMRVIDTTADGRRTVQILSGVTSGAYHSVPESGTASYGNTFKIAD